MNKNVLNEEILLSEISCLKSNLRYYRLRIQESSEQVQNKSSQNNLEIKPEQKGLEGRMVKKFY